MKLVGLTLSGMSWPCLAVTALLLQGCAQKPGWNGIFAVDTVGAAKTCVTPTTSVPDGQAVQAQVQVSDEGGWCGITISRGGVAYASYLSVSRPSHGRVFAHHVGTNTRIDYTPDAGFTGADSFAIRLIPGDGVLQEAITVTR